ncbi:MAG: lycopene cyclase [Sphingobacteriales bacterium]|nr:lycopene cyclase [Sphingobacteriales bacterium]
MTGTGRYDYIIAGAGCAGLSLAMHMIHSGKFREKKVLIVDRDHKEKNDRTWCFWEENPGLFESIVYKRWNNAWFHNEDFSRLISLSPYEYKLIRGKDFYDYCFKHIRQASNFDFQLGEIKGIYNRNDNAVLMLDDKEVLASYIFNSILFDKPDLNRKEYYLLQHFKGWVIETDKPSFNPDEAILMDFRVDQKEGTTFVYVMPFSKTKALVEYTVFSERLSEPVRYEEGLNEYISQILKIGSYQIVENEFGVIPMTNHRFPLSNGNIINIGTAGGQTKPSSGYTFRFIQKHSAAIIEKLAAGENPVIRTTKGRFRFYDTVLLNILYNQTLPGKKIFSSLFKKNKPQQLLRFLDNESSFAEELKIISSLPAWPFFKAALKQL